MNEKRVLVWQVACIHQDDVEEFSPGNKEFRNEVSSRLTRNAPSRYGRKKKKQFFSDAHCYRTQISIKRYISSQGLGIP